MSDILRDEILLIKTDAEKQAIKQTKELLKVYKRNFDDIQDQINRIYAKYTKDGVLNISTQQRYSVLTQLEKQLVDQMKGLGETSINITTDILTDVFKESFYKTAYAIEKGVSANTSFALLKPEFVKAAITRPIKGKDFSSRIWDNTNKLANRVKRDVEKALIQGTSPEKLARQIKKDFGSSAYQAKRLINTEVAKSVTMAQNEVYKNSGVVDKIMWDSTLDSLTAPEDAELDGKMWGIDEQHPEPPLHPNCRCCLIPVVDGWTPTKKRENIKDPITGEKKIIDYTTYDKWKESRF